MSFVVWFFTALSPSCWSQGQGLRVRVAWLLWELGVERSLSCGMVAGPGFADQGRWRLKAGGLPGAGLGSAGALGALPDCARSRLSGLEWDMSPFGWNNLFPSSLLSTGLPLALRSQSQWPCSSLQCHVCSSSGLPSGSAFFLEHCSLSLSLWLNLFTFFKYVLKQTKQNPTTVFNSANKPSYLSFLSFSSNTY